MKVSQQDVDQMASFMRALRSGQPPQPQTPQSLAAPQPAGQAKAIPAPREARSVAAGTAGGGGDGVQEMKQIMARFYEAAEGAVSSLNKDSATDRELREAMVTERTAHGTRIGAWEIQVREEGKRKFYNVVQQDGTACIASDLMLYEAAHGIVRILNEGGRLNSSPAINLLRAEQDYAAALGDAVLYKHYLTKHPNDARSRVFEAKYSAAQQRALSARDKVFALVELR